MTMNKERQKMALKISNHDFILRVLRKNRLRMDYENGIIYRKRGSGAEYVAALTTTPRGYKLINLSVDGMQKTCSAHRVIWMMRHGVIPDNLVINHKDNNKGNNSIGNLELTTFSENVSHCINGGYKDILKGEKHPGVILTAGQVKKIRKMFATGKYTQESLSKFFPVGRAAIGQIIRRETWREEKDDD